MRRACIIALSGLAFASSAGSARLCRHQGPQHACRDDDPGDVGPNSNARPGTTSMLIGYRDHHVRRVMAGEPFDLLVARLAKWTICSGRQDRRLDSDKSLVRLRYRRRSEGRRAEADIGSDGSFQAGAAARKTCGYLKEGQSGVYLHRLFRNDRHRRCSGPKPCGPIPIVSELVAKGNRTWACWSLRRSDDAGVELVGPIPAEIQSYITFVAGIGTNATAPDAARALLDFLKSPAVLTVIRAQGMEPG